MNGAFAAPESAQRSVGGVSIEIRAANLMARFTANSSLATRSAASFWNAGITWLYELRTSLPLLAKGHISDPDTAAATNDCGWADMGDVLEALRLGLAYVNVHSTAFPVGRDQGTDRLIAWL